MPFLTSAPKPPPIAEAVSLVDEYADTMENFALDSQYDLEVLTMSDRPGFKPFVRQNRDALRVLVSLRDEFDVLNHLNANKVLLEGIAHVRAWYFDRHLAAFKSKSGAKGASFDGTVCDEAAGFFLLDAAADAARSHFMSGDCQSVEHAAAMGVQMLAAALNAPDDPVGVRGSLGARVQAWLALVKQAAAQQRNKLKALSKATKTPQQGNDLAKQAAATAAARVEATTASNSDRSNKDSFRARSRATGSKPTAAPTGAAPESERPEEKKEEDDVFGGFFKGWFGN